MHASTAIERALLAPPLSDLGITAELTELPWVGGKGREIKLTVRGRPPHGDLSRFHHQYVMNSFGSMGKYDIPYGWSPSKGWHMINIASASQGLAHL